jgi:hypothetical protein
MAAGLGFKDFTTGEVLTAADVDGYLMQGVWVFASAAARDAAVTSPQEGNFAYLKDTNVTTYYTGSAWANLDTTGMTNPMTTTGDIIYSSSGSTPARLGIGSTGNVLTVAGGVPSWAAPAGGGKVLQVVMGTSTTSTSITSTSYADSGLSATITPSSASNKVLALIAQYAYISDNTDSAGVGYRLVRDSTAVYTVDRGSNKGAAIYAASASSVQLYIVVNGNYLDTPATTSATTYKMQGVVASGDNVYFQHDGQISTLILLEIGA